ncbi:hypothetical protein [Promicromonospora iranensis]|uniref:GntP family permease n=1 Tax=Promicromonospora iranensis TaxID=1105144 RepID=A0ABU2CQ97_9MICO|nr:hypothetical protein [Promicromonospora iranensis]MDR7383515.1 hypothetical protein [Promicromonospora iranensis]
MINVSLLVVLLIAAWIAVKYLKVKIGGLLLGVCVGLALASTSFGMWGTEALNELLVNMFSGANNMVEG